MARLLAQKTRRPIAPRFVGLRPGDVRHTWADISKAKRLLKYRAAVYFSQGLSRTVAWFKEHPEVWTPRY